MATAARPLRDADDPRQLRDHLARTRDLATRHGLPSVVVGLAAREGDLMAPDLLDFIESELRIEDAIFRMTRERAVLFLADVDRSQAESVVERLLEAFQGRFAAIGREPVRLGFVEVPPGVADLPVRDVLLGAFPEAA